MTTILVVEDEALIADDLQSTLIHLGYEVPVTVATGPDAIRAVEALHPALTLMDIKLKGAMDGVEAGGVIHERFGTPVVYLTSYSDDATLARAMRTAPYGYLLKPFDDRDLRTTVEVALHKHALEARLAERERWFSTTLRSVGDAVIATDPRGVVTFMNPVAEALTGWKAGAAIGEKLDDVLRLVGPDDVAQESPVARAVRAGFAVALPTNSALITREGARVMVDDSTAPIVDDRGHLLGGVVVFRDVTERRLLEERLARSEKLASLGTMAAGMAHEINNPLTYVVGNVSLVDESLARLEALLAIGPAAALAAGVREMRDALRDVSEGTERVRAIVHNMKKFALVESTDRATLDLPRVLDAAIRMSHNALRHCAVLSMEYGATPLVSANEGQLVQVFCNLLANATQAIGEGRADANRVRVVTYTDRGGRAVAEVHDTGCGVAKADLAKIFDPFFSTRHAGGGLGLGLSICHGVVAGLGGEITVESTVGKGTVFRVSLPPAPRPAEASSGAPGAPGAGRRGRVLVIDDEPAVARAVERMLNSLHEVVVETDARVALARLASGEAFDAIVCDLMMPNLTGQEVYESLATTRPDLARRVVFITGGALSPERQGFLDGVTNVVLAKPFTVASLRAVVADYVR